MATKLSLYNGALIKCGERKLASLGDPSPSRHVLDDVWDGGAIDYCLEMKQWTFATRSIELIANSDYEPDYGYKYIFDKPSDFIKTVAICSDEYYTSPLLSYAIEGDFIAADIETIYIRYVSNDEAYGGNMAGYSPSFQEMVKLYLASRIIGSISQDTQKIALITNMYRDEVKLAGSKDAFNKPTSTPPTGSWVRARLGC
jgi:hypothetical protein